MSFLARLRSLLRNLFRRSHVEHELDDEVRAYADQLADEKVAAGMPPEQARREARLELGGAEQVKEEVRDARSGAALDSLWQDVRFGARMLRKNPGFTAVAALTLALGIGASTAIFSVVEAILLRPLPYTGQERLLAIWKKGADQAHARWRMTPGDYYDLAGEKDAFEQVGAFASSGLVLTGEGDPEQLLGVRVTGSYFAVLGVRPLRGRFFTESEEQGTDPLVILSAEMWRNRFGGAEDIIGRSLRLDGQAYTVIGVMPPGVYPAWPATTGSFRFDPSVHQYWVPLRVGAAFRANRRSHVWGVVARTRLETQPAQAQQALNVFAGRLRAENPQMAEVAFEITPLVDEIVGGTRQALWFLMGAGVLALLIVCANVSGLVLVRLNARHREIAVRLALGAARGRLMRQLFLEGLMLGVIAAALGVAIAFAGLHALVEIAPRDIPRMDTIAMNGPVLGFALACTLLASLLYAVWPVWQATRLDVAAGLKESPQRTSAGRRTVRSRSAMVAAQVSLAVPLLAGAGLLMESFRQLMNVDPGFRAESVMTASVSLPSSRYAEMHNVGGFYERLLEALRRQPGVVHAATAYDHPLQTSWLDAFSIEGRAPDPDLPYAEAFRPVSVDYFRLLEIPLVRGRIFTEADGPGRPGVAVINESFARRYFGGDDLIGRRLRITTPGRIWPNGPPEFFEIVGVVGDVHSAGLTAPPEPAFYLPARQIPLTEAAILVRTSGDPLAMISTLRTVVAGLDPELPLQNAATLERILAGQRAQQRFSMLLMNVFGALALALVLVGLYGLLSYTVALRTQEIGIRLALGAQRGEILRLMMSHALRPVLVGAAIGIMLALAGTKLVSSLLFGVSPLDPVVFTATLLLLLAAAVAATLLPARRASRIDPMRALRYE